jgi:twinkle protein
MSKTELQRSMDWLEGKVFYTRPEGVVMWDALLDIFKQQMFQYGIDIFLVDAFNKVIRKDPDSRGEIEMILSRLTKFVQDYNVHLFLVAHPTKMKKKEDGTYSAPTLYDVKGTSDFRDQTHNGICVYRDFGDENGEGFTEITNLKTKFSHQGDIGQSVRMKFNVPSARYYDFGFTGQPESYFEMERQEVMTVNTNFLIDEEEDDLPF